MAITSKTFVKKTAHDLLKTRVDGTETNILSLDGRLDTIETALPALDTRLDTAEATLAGHETRLDAVEPSVSNHETRLDALEPLVTALDSRVDDAEETVGQFDGRMGTAETTLAGHETRLDAVEPALTALDNRLDSAEQSIDQHTAHLNQLDTEQAAQNNTLSNHDSTLTAHTQTLEDHEERITALEQVPPGSDPRIPSTAEEGQVLTFTGGEWQAADGGGGGEEVDPRLPAAVIGQFLKGAYGIPANTWQASDITWEDIQDRPDVVTQTDLANAVAGVTPNPLAHQMFFHEQLTQGTTDFWGDNSSNGSRALTAPGAGEVGVIRHNLLGTTTGRTVFGLLQNQLAPGAALTMVYQTKLKIVTLSDATNTWTARLGFASSPFQGGDPPAAAYFRYSHGVNGGKWQAVTRSGGTETAVDTGGTASTGVFQEFKVILTLTQATFYIDDVQVASISTNIPSAAMGFYVYSQRSSGTTSLDVFDVDWIQLDLNWSPSR
jgi:uncharacterized coiled-coil protein SlyX